MFSRRVVCTIISVLSFGVFGASVVSKPTLAQIPPQKIEVSKPSPPPSQALFIQELGLTSEQVEKIDTVRRLAGKEITQTKEELDRVEQELDTLINSANAPESQIREKFAQVEQLRQKLSSLTFESRLATRAVLTPEQRAAFEPAMERLREARRKSTGQQ